MRVVSLVDLKEDIIQLTSNVQMTSIDCDSSGVMKFTYNLPAIRTIQGTAFDLIDNKIKQRVRTIQTVELDLLFPEIHFNYSHN